MKQETYTIKKKGKKKKENIFLLEDGMKAVKWNIPSTFCW